MKKLFCYLMKLNVVRRVFHSVIYLLISVFLSCAVSTANSGGGATLKNSSLYVVDLDNAQKLESMNLSTFIKNVKVVRLEDHREGLIASVDKLIVHEGYFYVLDRLKAKSLFVFDGKGKFVRKIGRIGRGPGEYIQITDFTIDADKNQIITLDHGQMHFYNTDGTYIKTTRFKPHDGYSFHFQYYDGLIYTDYISFNIRRNTFLMQSLNPNDGERRSFFLDVNEHNKGFNESWIAGMPYFIPKHDPPFLFRHFFMDTIFSITNRGLMPYLAIQSRDFITKLDLQIPANTNTLEYLARLPVTTRKVFSIHNYFETSEIIHFSYLRNQISFSVFFSKNTGVSQVIEFVNFRNDLLFAEDRQNRIFPNFATFDEKGAYEIYHPNSTRTEVIIQLANEKKLKPPFNDILIDFNEESNPVIFYYEFK